MSEMIERAAKAIYDQEHRSNAENWQALTKEMARAVIEAMRMPPQEILRAGCMALDSPDAKEPLMGAALCSKPHTFARMKMRLRWDAMIDEALKETPNPQG